MDDPTSSQMLQPHQYLLYYYHALLGLELFLVFYLIVKLPSL